MMVDPLYQTKRGILENLATRKKIMAHFPFDPEGLIHGSIIDDMKSAFFIFADMSYERPSCYYELGLAQALGKKVFLVAQKGTILHQLQGTVSYYQHIEEYEQLAAQAIDRMSE
jgi:hypothetical protein